MTLVQLVHSFNTIAELLLVSSSDSFPKASEIIYKDNLSNAQQLAVKACSSKNASQQVLYIDQALHWLKHTRVYVTLSEKVSEGSHKSSGSSPTKLE